MKNIKFKNNITATPGIPNIEDTLSVYKLSVIYRLINDLIKYKIKSEETPENALKNINPKGLRLLIAKIKVILEIITNAMHIIIFKTNIKSPNIIVVIFKSKNVSNFKMPP